MFASCAKYRQETILPVRIIKLFVTRRGGAKETMLPYATLSCTGTCHDKNKQVKVGLTTQYSTKDSDRCHLLPGKGEHASVDPRAGDFQRT
jgi:hypothetical protein